MKLQPCHSRRELQLGGDAYFCAHPKMMAPGGVVTAEICKVCPLWRLPPPEQFRTSAPLPSPSRRNPCYFLGEQTGEKQCKTCQGHVRLKTFACSHPLHEETTAIGCGACRDYEEPLGSVNVRSWSVGVTTAPRARPTLARTLASLAAAGWTAPRLFAEPDSEIPAHFSHLPITRRDATLGAWPNFFLALSELVQLDPHADAYFLLQDDVVFSRNIRPYLERVLWPGSDLGLASVYCPSTYVRRRRGFHAVKSDEMLAGAVTCIFPNVCARLLLGCSRAIKHRRTGPHEGLRYIDSVLGGWCDTAGLKAYYHTPSLASHIGDVSTVWPHATNEGCRQAADFAGERFDANSLLSPTAIPSVRSE